MRTFSSFTLWFSGGPEVQVPEWYQCLIPVDTQLQSFLVEIGALTKGIYGIWDRQMGRKRKSQNHSGGMQELSLRNHILQIFSTQTVFAKSSPLISTSLWSILKENPPITLPQETDIIHVKLLLPGIHPWMYPECLENLNQCHITTVLCSSVTAKSQVDSLFKLTWSVCEESCLEQGQPRGR